MSSFDDTFDKLLNFFVERPDTNFTMKMTKEEISSNAPLSVSAGTDGTIILTWPGGSLRVPAAQRGTFLSMVQKAVVMSQQAVPTPNP